MIKDQYVVDKLKEEDLKTLDEVYLTYKKEFILFARTFSIPEDDIADVYQETIISLYENIQNKKLEHLTSTLKTYLFAIGKFKIYKQLQKNKSLTHGGNVIHISEEMQVFETEVDGERQQLLKKGLQQLGAKCRKILELYYYKGMTLDEIQAELDYTSKDVLKSQKSRCLKQLKELVKKSYE
ncbi:MAG: sigma-70 family RNA polymerase sigma factor [Flavobacteriaceae bacterium]